MKNKEVLALLKKETELPSSKIAFILNVNYYQIDSILKQLEKEGKIKKKMKGKYTYWSLK